MKRVVSNEAEVKNIFRFRFLELWKKVRGIREATVVFIIIIMGAILSILSNNFLTADNLSSIAIGLSTDGIVVVGMTIALVSGGFDLSAGAVMALSGVTTGALYLAGLNIWLACVIGIAVGVLLGYANGFFIGRIGLNPFITTLAVMGIARGASYALTQGSPISLYGVSGAFKFIGQGNILKIPVIVIIFIVVAFFGDFMMRRSEYIRKVLYTGSNEKAAIFSGIDTSKVKLGVYILVAVLASIAGILSLSRFLVATPASGSGVDVSMRSISAAVIGGASLSGGEGTIIGSILGLIVLNIINNGLILLNIPVYWQDMINGVILLVAVTADYMSHKGRRT